MYFPEVRFLEKNQQGAKVQMEAGKINKKRLRNAALNAGNRVISKEKSEIQKSFNLLTIMDLVEIDFKL